MNRIFRPLRLGILVTVFILIAIALQTTVLRGQLAPSASTAKTANQAFKNIQLLKGIPAEQLIPTMQFISASLGVECEYCHVEGAFEKDDKKPKQTARKMMEMMFAVNKDSFQDRRAVTCYSCHRGTTRPLAIPLIPSGADTTNRGKPTKIGGNDIPAEDQGTNLATVIDPILEKYIAGLGGAASIQNVASRVENGSADLAGKQFPIEIYSQAPDKRISVMHLPNGDSITAYNGTVGWRSVPGHPIQWMVSGEIDASRLEADLLLPMRMRKVFSDLRLLPTDKIEGRDVNVLQALREGKPPVNFYFDQQTGLLMRLVEYTDTALGLNPTQIDYADYRDSSGVKIPYRWTVARPRGKFTIQIESVQQNVPLDERKFVPPAPGASEQKPSSR
jgi:photosynthetic reaction center cytochrome c subunit